MSMMIMMVMMIALCETGGCATSLYINKIAVGYWSYLGLLDRAHMEKRYAPQTAQEHTQNGKQWSNNYNQ